MLIYHDILRYPRFMQGQEMGAPLLPGFAEGELGIMPVLWFFLLSGFVIALTLERCRNGTDFILRRASRIYPAYWTTIALVWALTLIWPLRGMPLTTSQILLNFTMVQSYFNVPDLTGVFWSLSVELLFYAYALVIFLWRKPGHTTVIIGIWSIASLISAIAVRFGQPVSWQLSRLFLLTYGPLLAGGMMLYRLRQGRQLRWSAAILIICGAAVVFRFHPVTAFTCFLAATAIRWSARSDSVWLASRPLVGLGAISYALYLSHETFSYTIIAGLDARRWPHAVSVALAILASLLLATLITYGIERPAMRLLRQRGRKFSLLKA